MPHPRLAVLLLVAAIVLPGRTSAQPATPTREVVYDIRDLAGKRDLTKVAQVVQRLTAAVETESIDVLNGTRLVIRATDKQHAQIIEVLQALRRRADLAVLVRADLYEVDEAFYTKLKNVRRVDPEELERQFLAGTAPKSELWPMIDKQKPLLVCEEIKLDNGGQAGLLSRHRAVSFLPSPERARRGDKERQTLLEGVSFLAAVQVTADRRYVRVKLTEKATEVQDAYKMRVFDPMDTEVQAEVPFVRESTQAQTLQIADGGSILINVQYRPRSVQEGQRRWVLAITTRIFIQEEEDEIRRGKGK